MTTVKIYGLLSKEFGETIKIHLGKINDVLIAIDAVKNGFRKKINELNKNKLSYCIQIDKKNKTLYILPIIGGSGKAWKWVVTALLVVVAVVAFALGMPMLGVSLLSSAFSMAEYAMTKIPSPPKPPDQSVGGAAYASEAAGKSYVFSNNINSSEQGSAIPVGYGKIKTSSSVIFSSVLNYPTNSKPSEEFIGNESLVLFSEFLAN